MSRPYDKDDRDDRDDEHDEYVARVEIEVPGTPEQVWAAIATGPGTTAWFVPAEIEEHEGGTITTRHGPFGESVGTVTVWDPPRRFAYEERDWNPDAPDAPVWATEILVEGRDGGTCVVRLVSGFHEGGEGWGDALDGTREGWVRMMANLAQYLTHFPGEAAAQLFVGGRPGLALDQARARLRSALGLDDAVVGQTVGPPVAGVVVEDGDEGVLVRSGDGLLEAGAWEHCGEVIVSIRAVRYGAACGGVADEQLRWSAWLHDLFPALAAPVG